MIDIYKTKISKTSQKRRDKESCIARSYRKVILSIFLACNIFDRYLCASADLPHRKNIMNLPPNIKKLVQEFQSHDFELLHRIFNNFCAEYKISGDLHLLIKEELINQIYSSHGHFRLYSKFNDAKNKFKEEIKNNLEIDKLIKAMEAIDEDKSIILSNPYILKEIGFLEFIIGGLAMINSDNPKILELKEIALNEQNPIVKKTKISKAILNLNSDPDFDSNLLELRGFLNSNSLSSDKYGPLYLIVKEILFTINDGLSYYSNDVFKKYNIVTLYQAFIDEFNVLNSISTSHGIDKYRSVYENDPDLKPIMDDAIKFVVINDLILYRKTIKYPKKNLHDLILGKIIKFINNREFDYDIFGIRIGKNIVFSELKNNIQSKIGNDKFSYYLNVHFF